MSSDEIVISAQGLSKCYPIFSHPRDRLKQFIVPALQRMAGFRESRYFHEFWSLRDVSLEIRRGDTVGIIGRNGAGKSTLLQILCGTLDPTTGSYQTKGRVAALLELGSGFNPEFSGRDNVYLNATLLGLTREEVDARFDAIAAFADIGEFIEQPVKTYSSGMYVRLAFAVIAHVDADILVVDEALAVGDAIFTQKCMRFIRSFQERGTLLFVSHDVTSVTNLCRTALWLDGGRVRELGDAKDVCDNYLEYTFRQISGETAEAAPKPVRAASKSPEGRAIRPPAPATSDDYRYADTGMTMTASSNLNESNGWQTGMAELTSVTFLNDESGQPVSVLKGGERVRLCIEGVAHAPLDRPIIGFYVRDRLGQNLFGENTLNFTKEQPMPAQAGSRLRAEFGFVLPMLPNGHYGIVASLADGTQQEHTQHHWLHDAVLLEVSASAVRWGIVGIPFKAVSLSIHANL